MAENHTGIMNFIYRTNKIRKLQYFYIGMCIRDSIKRNFLKKEIFDIIIIYKPNKYVCSYLMWA